MAQIRWVLGLFVISNTLLAAEPAEWQTFDLAKSVCRDDWLRHPVYGDPSFDSFEHRKSNPVHRGSPPYEWPVNGFFLQDQSNKDWYIYVGHYLKNYAIDTATRSRSSILHSTDRGETWRDLGWVFPQKDFCFQGEISPMNSSPDVQVTYADGFYHMVFDWGTTDLTWENANNPEYPANGGVAHARSPNAAGPFEISPAALATTRERTALIGKYRRVYGPSLIKRQSDWLLLTLSDFAPYGWSLVGQTAKQPEGPYEPPSLLLHPESLMFYPPLIEYYPVFVQEGYIYSPGTSVALNRNFQVIYRAPIEKAHEPRGWELYQYGSVWHSEDVEHEYDGIWGQTFSGFIDDQGMFQVMYPSRDSQGSGTINLASRPWNQPYRDGLVFSGHEGPGITWLRSVSRIRQATMEFTLNGKMRLLWGGSAVLGPKTATSGATLHSLATTNQYALGFDGDGWAVMQFDRDGNRSVIASGECPMKGPQQMTLISEPETGSLQIRLGDKSVWSGQCHFNRGPYGLYINKRSHLSVSRFEVVARREPQTLTYLYTDALLGAAAPPEDWKKIQSPGFRFGHGVSLIRKDAIAKWNFRGMGFTLFAPKQKDFGKAELILDGESLGVLDCSGEGVSSPVYKKRIPDANHALIIRCQNEPVPLDCLEVSF